MQFRDFLINSDLILDTNIVSLALLEDSISVSEGLTTWQGFFIINNVILFQAGVSFTLFRIFSIYYNKVFIKTYTFRTVN